MNYRKFSFQIVTFAFLLLAFNSFAHSQSCSPVSVGLVSWYSGDGNALDRRSGNNGTLQNGATFAAGRVGQGFSLDGIDDVVNASQPNPITSSFTAEAWINPTSLANNPVIFERGTSVPNRIGMQIQANGILGGYMGGSFSVSGGAIPINAFTHVVYVFDDGANSARLYVNGIQVAAATENGNPAGATGPLTIGVSPLSGGSEFFAGRIDEVSLYNRALTDAEIAAIASAGTAGKCKPTATVAPSGQVGWWAGDGNANDIAGTSNATLQNGAGFAVGKVGQSFTFDGTDDVVQIPFSAGLGSSNFTVESWVRPTGQVNDPINQENIVGQSSGGPQLLVLTGTTGVIPRIQFKGIDNSFPGVASAAEIPIGQFSHLVGTFDGTTLKIFVNGVLQGQSTPAVARKASTCNFTIAGFTAIPAGGGCDGSTGSQFFNGQIDEASLYNRALTDAEITSIVNAGIAGKLKDNSTPAGSNVTVSTKSDATVNFPTVTTAGITQQIPLDISLLPALPGGSTAVGLAYDFSTSASFTGTATLCFTLPSLSAAQFSNLGVLHLEAGVWVDRGTGMNTTARVICASPPTLSPFVIAQVLAPTAASGSISGRLLTQSGRGISGARLSLTDSLGNTRTASTGSFGYYRFEDLPVGENYVLSVASKRYQFANPSRLISVLEDLTDVDFVASP